MAMDPRKRQKKLERRKAKQRAERREWARRQSEGISARLLRASSAPILHCCVPASIWDNGIGNVLISRQLPNGDVAVAVFLVDTYCLGVKNAFAKILPRGRYEHELYAKLVRKEALAPVKPEYARKLVESAVEYALDLGLSPHPDYRVAKLIFGDISAEACPEEFVFGKGGKPLFIAGPHDDGARCHYILRTLEEHCGPDGYHYLLPLEGTELVRIVPCESDD